ncbi:MAG: hypothetical protein EXR11_04620 [Rhodospirillaceae bacterium]|nr:hypothetical protein [Rhodospirillaceae bacterium]
MVGLTEAALAQGASVPAPQADSIQVPINAPGVSVSDDGTRVIYGQEFFAQYGAVTAVDILKRIPGIQDVVKLDNSLLPGGNFQQNERRGFGSTGEQILINGERLSGKTNDTTTTLQRIQARQVDRVEVIRGAVAGLDVRSEGLVVNVVLKESAGSGSWEGIATHYSGGRVRWGGRASYSGSAGALTYNVAVEQAARFQQRDRVETYINLSGAAYQRQFEINEVVVDERILTANTGYTFTNGDRLALNGRYGDKDELEEFPVYSYALSGATSRFVVFDDRERDTAEKTWEVGGDYSHDFTGGGQFKGLFVYTHGAFDRTNPFRLTPAGGREALVRLQNEDRANSEKIVRGSYRWGLSQSINAEAGSEVAINTLNKTVQLFVDQSGTLRPVILFNAKANIRETRFEPFTNLSWQATPSLFVDANVEVEYSKLNQTGADVNNRRSLFFVRPGLDLRYDVTPLTQLRAFAHRTISQLDFANFVATFENDDNRSDVVNAGNPNIVPTKAWEYALTLERRLPSDGGVVSIKTFYNDVSDRIDNIAVGPTRSVSAVGNTGPGREYGVEAKTSIRLGALGLPGAVVNASGTLRHSQATDAFTGARTKYQDHPNYSYTVGFRHDTEWRDFSYGVTMDKEGQRYSSDINYYHLLDRYLDGTAFVEMRAVGAVKAKLEIRRFLRAGAHRERFTYTGNRGLSTLLRQESRSALFEQAIAFTLRGTF